MSLEFLQMGDMERRFLATKVVVGSEDSLVQHLGNPDFPGWLKGEEQTFEQRETLLDKEEIIVLL